MGFESVRNASLQLNGRGVVITWSAQDVDAASTGHVLSQPMKRIVVVRRHLNTQVNVLEGFQMKCLSDYLLLTLSPNCLERRPKGNSNGQDNDRVRVTATVRRRTEVTQIVT